MVSKEVTTAKKFCSEVDVTFILEETIVVESEGMLDTRKNDFLIFNVVNMLACNNLRLFHRLDGELFIWAGLQPADPNISKCAYTDQVKLAVFLRA